MKRASLSVDVRVQVCAKSCSQEATHCDTLAAWSLRLDTGLVTDGSFLQTVQPGKHLRPLSHSGFLEVIHSADCSEAEQNYMRPDVRSDHKSKQ